MTEVYTTNDKVRVAVNPDGIPDVFKEFDHWVVHQNKEPFNATTGNRASTTDSRTWCAFSEALEAYETGRWEGIGFVFSSGDPFVFIDFDKCRDAESGEVREDVLEYIERFENYYAEVSPSGTGVHLITGGKLRGGAKKNGYEVYGQERFATFTGKVLDA